ncbi:MAG: Uma2 family endonuclease [Polyangiales bacterium]
MIDPRFPQLSSEVVAAFLAAPETLVAEVIDGELSLLPRPRPRHANAATRLARRLGGFFDPIDDEPGGWVILAEPELRLGPGPDIVAPDLAGWRRPRFPENALEDNAPAFLSVAPDWVCEVLSPSTQSLDRGRKMRVYRREGIAHLWYLDPEARTVEVYRLERGRYALLDTYEDDAVIRAEPFESADLALASLWRL